MSPRAGDWIETRPKYYQLVEQDVPSCGGLDRNLKKALNERSLHNVPSCGGLDRNVSGTLHANDAHVPSCGGLDRNSHTELHHREQACPLVRGTG